MKLTNEDYKNIKAAVAQHMYNTQNWFPGHAPAGTKINYYQGPKEGIVKVTLYEITFTAAGAFEDNDQIELVGENHYKSNTGAEFDAYIVY